MGRDLEVNRHDRYTQQAQWTVELRRYLLQRAGLDKARRVLDVGCGTGAVLSTLPASPETQITGLDIDYTHLSLAAVHAPNARLVQGDALSLPYSANSFDIIYCHFLLLWVSNPLAALQEMARVTRPGGWVLALAEPDYGGRIDYPDLLAEVGRIQAEALRDQGADPQMGRKLPGLLNRAGLVEVSAGVMGGQWQMPEAGDDWRQEWEVLRLDLGDRLSAVEIERLYSVEEQARKTGGRVLFVPTFYASGSKPTR